MKGRSYNINKLQAGMILMNQTRRDEEKAKGNLEEAQKYQAWLDSWFEAADRNYAGEQNEQTN